MENNQGNNYLTQTVLDEMVTDDNRQMLKAFIPYLPFRGQQFLSAASTTIIATATAKQQEYNDQPAVVTTVATAAAISAAIVATAAHENDDPENAVTGTSVSKTPAIIATAVTASVTTSTSFFTSTVCSS